MKKKRIVVWIRRIVLLICVVAFCYSAFQLGFSYWSSLQQKKIREEVAVAFNLPEKIEESKELKIDFTELHKINPDIVAYVVVPKTNISYPIVYKKNDTNYYLRRDLNGNYSLPGSIFLDGEANPLFTDRHTFVYGHNMLDKTMFGDIFEFMNKEYFDERDTAYIFTPTKKYKLDILAFETSKVDGQAYETVGLDSDGEMEVYLNNLKKNAKHYRAVDVKNTDSLVSFSTCGHFDMFGTRDVLHLRLREWK